MQDRPVISQVLSRLSTAYLLPTRAGQAVVRHSDRPFLAAPIVIGGTGGSGTRAVRHLLDLSGVFMGNDVNAVGDAMPFEPLLERSINPLLSATRSLSYRLADLPKHLRRRVSGEFMQSVRRYLRDMPYGCSRWGWKNPRSIYFLPFVHAVFPNMCFIHVIRDGRDMAISANQNQYRKHYSSLFGASPDGDDIIGSCRMWARTNDDAADWGETTLGRRYLRVRLEDLCAAPQETAASMLEELGLDPGNAVQAAQSLIKWPTLGRWRSLPGNMGERLTSTAALALRRFGYHRL